MVVWRKILQTCYHFARSLFSSIFLGLDNLDCKIQHIFKTLYKPLQYKEQFDKFLWVENRLYMHLAKCTDIMEKYESHEFLFCSGPWWRRKKIAISMLRNSSCYFKQQLG